MKKRAMTLLAVAGLAGTAHAAEPRVLPTGAPACGNVMGKYGAPVEDPLCAVFRNLRDLEALGRKFEAALTLARAGRPGL